MGRLLRSVNDRGLDRNMDTHLPLSTGSDGRSSGGYSEYRSYFDGRYDLCQRPVRRLSHLPRSVCTVQFQATIQRRTKLI
jgi:hypothetical protein